jgi:hypothetical protein
MNKISGLLLMMVWIPWFCISADDAWTHPISISAVAVNVRKDDLMANMKIMLEDLVLYNSLQAGEDDRYAREDLVRAAENHGDFLLKGFAVRDSEGNRIPGKITRIDMVEIPPQGVRQAELMARNVYYHLSFTLPTPQEFLTFTQEFGGKNAVLPAVMDFTAFQDRVLLQRQVKLFQGLPHTVKFDWKSPPARSSRSWSEYQNQMKQEFRSRLGITSYSGLYSFIYITKEEVRHEILIPLVTLEKWLPLKRLDPDYIEVAEQEAAQAEIAEFFSIRNPVIIDGIPVKPLLKRLQFFGLDIRDFALNAKPRRISIYQARVGIILSYATKNAAKQVQMTWDTFNKYAPFMRSVVYIHDSQPQIQHFTQQKSQFEWHRQGEPPVNTLLAVPKPKVADTFSIPLITIGAFCGAFLWLTTGWLRRQQFRTSRGLGGSVLLLVVGLLCWPIASLNFASPFAENLAVDESEARAITEALLGNIYRAFDYRDDSQIYDALAYSVDGKLLEDIFLQIQLGLQMQEQGGAVSRVREIELVDNQIVASDTQPTGPNQFNVQCRWWVTGSVEHWGHIHTRKNEYEALLTLMAKTDTWKITNYEVLNERRLMVKTGLRTMKISN